MKEKQPPTPTNIYQTRHHIGKERQRHYNERHLDSLHQFIESNKLDNPYQLDVAWYRRLLQEKPTLTPGARGRDATFAEGVEYLYRLSSVWAITHNTTQWTATLDPDDVNEAHQHIEAELSRQRRQYTPEREWLPLSWFAQGTLTEDWGATWWTDLEIQPTNVIQAKRQLGLTRRNSKPPLVVLRCRAAYVAERKLALVPNVVDGYASLVFHPIRCSEDSKPIWGITINLEEPEAPREGEREYVLLPLPVDAIEVCPVLRHHNAAGLEDIEEDPRFWRMLDAYYRQMLGATERV